MMGRLCGPDWASRSGAAPCSDSSARAAVPTPAATAPRREVLTKSRREKVMFLLLARKREAYHASMSGSSLAWLSRYMQDNRGAAQRHFSPGVGPVRNDERLGRVWKRPNQPLA